MASAVAAHENRATLARPAATSRRAVLVVGEDAQQGGGEGVAVAERDELGAVAGDLGDRAGAGGDDRQPDRPGPRGSGTRSPRRATGRRARGRGAAATPWWRRRPVPGRTTRRRAAGGRAATAASRAALSSPGAPARTSAAPSVAAGGAERGDERGEVLAPLDGAEGEHERAERRSPTAAPIGRAACRHGERAEVDDLDAVAPSSSRAASAVAWLEAWTVGPGADAAAEDLAGPADVGRRLVRVAQEPAVVDRHDRRPAGRRDDVVRAVDDVGGAEPAVDAGAVADRPQPVGDGGRAAAAGARAASGRDRKLSTYGLDVDAGVAVEGGAPARRRPRRPGAVAVERADVEGDANRVHDGSDRA